MAGTANVVVAGAQYSDVPSVILKDTGGNDVVFTLGSGGLTYETGIYTPTSDIARPEILFANSHSEAPILVAMSDTSAASGITANSAILFCYYDPYKMFGSGFPYSTSAARYAVAYYSYRTSSGATNAAVLITYNSDNTTDSSQTYPRYWASPTGFHPYVGSSSRYWRAGRTYKWVAVWK